MKNEDVRSFYFFFNLNFLDRERKFDAIDPRLIQRRIDDDHRCVVELIEDRWHRKFDAIDPRLIQRRIDDDHSSRDAITCNGNYAMYRRGGNRHSPNTGNSKG